MGTFEYWGARSGSLRFVLKYVQDPNSIKLEKMLKFLTLFLQGDVEITPQHYLTIVGVHTYP